MSVIERMAGLLMTLVVLSLPMVLAFNGLVAASGLSDSRKRAIFAKTSRLGKLWFRVILPAFGFYAMQMFFTAQSLAAGMKTLLAIAAWAAFGIYFVYGAVASGRSRIQELEAILREDNG